MDKIDNINGIVGLLRSQLSKNIGKRKNLSGSGQSNIKSTNKLTTQALDKVIRSKLKKIEQDDPNKHVISVKIIVESILAWEFGDAIISDPEFSELVNKIVTHISSSSAMEKYYSEYISST